MQFSTLVSPKTYWSVGVSNLFESQQFLSHKKEKVPLPFAQQPEIQVCKFKTPTLQQGFGKTKLHYIITVIPSILNFLAT